MKRFSVLLTKTGFGASTATLPADLVLVPESWSASDRGGCKQASVRATGPAESLAYLAGWVGDRIEIYNDMQDLVWWGILWDVEISLGNVVANLSLDHVYNRVAVIYPYILPDGSEESRTTAWAEDSNSVARYGKRELLYGLPAQFSQSPETVRDLLLARYSTPGAAVTTQASASYAARLYARGHWEKAAAVYFTNPDGLHEHTSENGSVVIGRYLVSNQVKFADDAVNDGSDNDLINDAGGLAALTAGTTFTITGAADPENNDTWTVENQVSASHIEITGTFDNEAAGANVKISWGESEAQDNIVQAFQLEQGWTVTHVALKVRRLGTPSDNFRIGIYPDSAGVPGVFLTAQEVVGSALYTELTWTEFELITPVQLSAATTYYIGVRRTGSATLEHGYEVALDEELGYSGGSMRVYNGSAWVARTPDADMPFRLIGEIDSTEQLERAIDMVDEFRLAIIQVDSNVPIRPYRADPRPVVDEMEEMIEAGTSTGERLIAWVAPDESVVVQTAPPSSASNLILGGDGLLRYPGGQRALYPAGKLIYGQYIDIDGLMLLDSVGIRAQRGASVYIQESSYDAASGRISVQSEGAVDPWSALSIRKG